MGAVRESCCLLVNYHFRRADRLGIPLDEGVQALAPARKSERDKSESMVMLASLSDDIVKTI